MLNAKSPRAADKNSSTQKQHQKRRKDDCEKKKTQNPAAIGHSSFVKHYIILKLFYFHIITAFLSAHKGAASNILKKFEIAFEWNVQIFSDVQRQKEQHHFRNSTVSA